MAHLFTYLISHIASSEKVYRDTALFIDLDKYIFPSLLSLGLSCFVNVLCKNPNIVDKRSV